MARGYANVKFEWNGSASEVIKNLGFGKDLQKDAAQILYDVAYDYMPYKSGILANRVRISGYDKKANITHLVRYANRQYTADEGNPYGHDVIVHRTRNTHELATSRWYDWAWKMHKAEITKKVDERRAMYRRMPRSKSHLSSAPFMNTNLDSGDWIGLVMMLLTGGRL